MTTQVSSWVGSTPQGRIEIVYSIGYNPDHTAALVQGTAYIATDFALSDSQNDWSRSGTFGASSGSNLSVQHGSSGGKTAIFSFSKWMTSNASIAVSISGLNGVGVTVSGSFTIAVGDLAAKTDDNHKVDNLAATSFRTDNINVVSWNGGVRNNIKVEVSRTASGGTGRVETSGIFGDFTITGLTRYTVYYWRVSVSTSAYGWGPWSSWASFKTLKAAPSKPYGYSAGSIGQTEFKSQGVKVTDNGGATLNNLRMMVNKTQTSTGATIIETGTYKDALIEDLDPGTGYWFRISVANGYMWSDYGDWVFTTTLPGVLLLLNGVWHNVIPYIKVDEVWYQSERYVKLNDVWIY